MTKNLFIHNEFLPYLRRPCHNASSVPLYSVYTLILSSKRCSHTKAPHVKLLEVHCNIHNFAMCPIFRKCFRKNAYLLLFCNTFKIAEAGSPSRSAMQAKQGMPTEPSALASWSICDQKMPWTKMQCPIGSPWLAVKHWWWTAVQSCLTSHKTWCGHNFWILHILTQMFIKFHRFLYVRSSYVFHCLAVLPNVFFFPFYSSFFFPSSAPVQQVLEQIHAGPPSWIGPRLKQHRCCWMRLEDFVQQKTVSATEKLRKTSTLLWKEKNRACYLCHLL